MKALTGIGLVLLFIGCGGQDQETPRRTARVASIPVQVAPITQAQIQETIRTTGELQPLYRLDIYPKVAGVVTKELVAAGQVVKKDQVLAEVVQDLPGMEFTPVQVQASREGTITRDFTEVGARVTPQQPLYTISKINPIDAVVDLPEAYAGKVKKGQPVSVQLDAFPDETFSGRVAEIAQEVNSAARTVAVKIRLPNPNRRLKPGMFCRVPFVVASHQGLLAPLDAVVHSGVATYIFVIRNGKAVELPVKTGTVVGEQVEVIGEVSAGDFVVVLGQNLLEDGTPVTIVEER